MQQHLLLVLFFDMPTVQFCQINFNKSGLIIADIVCLFNKLTKMWYRCIMYLHTINNKL